MSSPQPIALSPGSTWRRWDPHLHAPGTLLNDQFDNDWDGYLRAIERATPAIEVLGVTDYFSTACYQAVRSQHAAGRLPGVKLLFPNVEMRLDLSTEKKKGVNLHLLFSPEDPDHVSRIERVLSDLTFEYAGTPYRCTPSDLAALGRAFNPKLQKEEEAQKGGANQFKVTLDKLKALFRNHEWVVRNCVVGVSSSSTDGTAGLQNDSSFAATRKEVERFAQVIFGSAASTRSFWLGRHPGMSAAMLEQEYRGRKPCLHGCDAHDVAKVGAPDAGRRCWLKGDPTFETLRQAILEPEERVWIGAAPPERPGGSSQIEQVLTRSAPWLRNNAVPLNPGLVAIIGPRGSGKTAIADLIARGANAISPLGLEASFLYRASTPNDHLGDGEVGVRWGDQSLAYLPIRPDADGTDHGPPGVRYLSQQFVEQLCSAEGLAVELRREIERVIFEATGPTERYDTDSFQGLADVYLTPIRRLRQELQGTIANTSSQVVAEEHLQTQIPAIRKNRDDLQKKIERTAAEMKALMPQGKEDRAKRLAELESALAVATSAIDVLKRRGVQLDDLRKEAARIRQSVVAQQIVKLQQQYRDAGLSSDDWAGFGMAFVADVDAMLVGHRRALDAQIARLKSGDPTQPVDKSRDPLAAWPHDLLLDERNKAKVEVGIDQQKQRRYTELQRSLNADERALLRAAADLDRADGAAARRLTLIEQRRELYAQVFDTYLDEQRELQKLYGPLQASLTDATGSLGKLRFSVSRHIDLRSWVERGEELLDLRLESKLRGHGSLAAVAGRVLQAAWSSGTAQDVSAAMHAFIQEVYGEVRKSMPSTVRPDRAAEWWQRVAAWLYDTAHIEMRYSVTYDGVAIEHLSPGTRGIVLLMLYLVIDKHDVRPLIIDQPEENLDPKSVFEELVPHFREARRRRQVVIVTHNANLVVNTDADQVIIASAQRTTATGLPTIGYTSGSLEDPDIRSAVCDILEGGERAFLDRERRYRLHWERVVEETVLEQTRVLPARSDK